MDALPVQELADVPYASEVPGAMHACEHDLHMAMVVGAAKILAQRADRLPGDVVLMFQPGEELGTGAAAMIADGILDLAGRRADAAYAIHVFSGLGTHGQVLTRAGTIMSTSIRLDVTVTGQGGHGSAPHKPFDPVTAIADMVTSLQTAITRSFDVFDPVVLSIGLLEGGTTSNIIPGTARFEGSLRTFSPAATQRAEDVFRRIEGSPVRRELALVRSAESRGNPAVDAVADVLRAEVPRAFARWRRD